MHPFGEVKMPYLLLGLCILGIFLLVSKAGAFTVSIGGNKILKPPVSPKAPYEGLIAKAADTWGIENALIKAIIRKESSFNSDAINPKDPSYGLMGITPIAAQDFGFVRDYNNVTNAEIASIFDVENNVNIGVRRLVYLLGKYPFDTAVQMYNVGESGYNSGRRNYSYLSEVKRFYNEYKI